MEITVKNSNGAAILKFETIEMEQPTPENGMPIQYHGQMLTNQVKMTRVGNDNTSTISRSEIYRFAQAIINNTI